MHRTSKRSEHVYL